MARLEKLLEKILLGYSDANIDFADLLRLLSALGFNERVKGSHHIFSSSSVEEIINIQPKKSKAKAYRVKQIRNIILKYRLGAKDD